MGAFYYKYVPKILMKKTDWPHWDNFPSNRKSIKRSCLVAMSALRIYGCGLHRAFYIKENRGERIVCRYLQGMQLSTKWKKARGENLLENCTVHGFRRKMRNRGLCVCRHIKGGKIRSLLNRNKKRDKNEMIKISKGKDKGVP
jgi:hypothetical protein